MTEEDLWLEIHESSCTEHSLPWVILPGLAAKFSGLNAELFCGHTGSGFEKPDSWRPCGTWLNNARPGYNTCNQPCVLARENAPANKKLWIGGMAALPDREEGFRSTHCFGRPFDARHKRYSEASTARPRPGKCLRLQDPRLKHKLDQLTPAGTEYRPQQGQPSEQGHSREAPKADQCF